MPKKTAKNQPSATKAEYLQLRVTAEEKVAFEKAAELCGVGVSSWVRERLRRACRRELEEAGIRAPFVPSVDTYLESLSNG
jgi:uncharacterized protein (DUF1778 family)